MCPAPPERRVASLLLFSPIFHIEDEEKWRNQKLELELRLPVGTIIHLNDYMDEIIYDIENVIGTYDSDMVGRKWAMRKDGLMCVDCDGLNENFSYEDRKKLKRWLKKLERLAKKHGEDDLKQEIRELSYDTKRDIDNFESELDYVMIMINRSEIADLEQTSYVLENIREVPNIPWIPINLRLHATIFNKQ